MKKYMLVILSFLSVFLMLIPGTFAEKFVISNPTWRFECEDNSLRIEFEGDLKGDRSLECCLEACGWFCYCDWGSPRYCNDGEIKLRVGLYIDEELHLYADYTFSEPKVKLRAEFSGEELSEKGFVKVSGKKSSLNCDKDHTIRIVFIDNTNNPDDCGGIDPCDKLIGGYVEFTGKYTKQVCDVSSKTPSLSTSSTKPGDKVEISVDGLPTACQGDFEIYFSHDSSKDISKSYRCGEGSIYGSRIKEICTIPTTDKYTYNYGMNYIFVWIDDGNGRYDKEEFTEVVPIKVQAPTSTTTTTTSTTTTTIKTTTTTTTPQITTAEIKFFDNLNDCKSWNTSKALDKNKIPRCKLLYMGVNANRDLSMCSNFNCTAKILVTDASGTRSSEIPFASGIISGKVLCFYPSLFVPGTISEEKFTVKLFDKDNNEISHGSIDVKEDTSKNCCEENEYCGENKHCCSGLVCEKGQCKSTTSTTTTTSSTTTTTTLPPQPTLTCEESSIYATEVGRCWINNCDDGLWFVYNLEKDPLEEEIMAESIASKNEISFATDSEGKVRVIAVCTSPTVSTLSEEIEVKKGLTLTCPDTCRVGEGCECEVEECEEGELTMRLISDGDVVDKDVVDVTESPFSYIFVPIQEGKAKVRVNCYEPKTGTRSTEIAVEPGVLPKKVEISEVECNKERCKLEVSSNTMEDVIVYVYLIDEDGKVYYSTMGEIEAKRTGRITFPLGEVEECPEGKELEVLLLVYKKGEEERILRLKEYAFKC